MKSQVEERAVNKSGISKEIQIERVAENTFTVRSCDKSRSYNFSTIGVDEKIAKDFEIPKENARNIVGKAKNQSVLQNKIHNLGKKKPKSTSVETPKIQASKGLKR